MRPAEGQDYLEFMLYNALPAPDARGTKNHASLTIPDADKALAEMKQRAAKVGYTSEIVIQTGVNKKRQINLYDPDGTRIELMEAEYGGRSARAEFDRARAAPQPRKSKRQSSA